MTIENSNTKITATGTGSTNIYPYTNIKIFDDDQLEVRVTLLSTGVETTLTKTTDYTVSGVGLQAGGNVTLVDADQAWLDASGYLRSTYSITIRRAMEFTQNTSITSQSSNLPELHEKQFDRHVMAELELREEVQRALQLPVTETGSSTNTTIPDATTRASKALGFDASGNPTAMTVTTVGAPLTATYVTLTAAGDLSAERVLTGTANQITVTDAGANSTVTLSTPQNIHTTATPTFGNLTINGSITETQAVSTSGSPTAVTVTGGAHTTLTASTESIDVNINLARTVQFATGAKTLQRSVHIQPATLAAVGASTTKYSTTLYVEPPAAGTNMTLTRTSAIHSHGHLNINSSFTHRFIDSGMDTTYTIAAFSSGLIAIGQAAAGEGNAPFVKIDGSLGLRFDAEHSFGTSQNNLDIGDVGFVRLNATAGSLAVTGLVPPNSSLYSIIYVSNVGANDITISNESASSTEANRILTGTGADLTFATAKTITMIYDATSTRWRIAKNA